MLFIALPPRSPPVLFRGKLWWKAVDRVPRPAIAHAHILGRIDRCRGANGPLAHFAPNRGLIQPTYLAHFLLGAAIDLRALTLLTLRTVRWNLRRQLLRHVQVHTTRATAAASSSSKVDRRACGIANGRSCTRALPAGYFRALPRGEILPLLRQLASGEAGSQFLTCRVCRPSVHRKSRACVHARIPSRARSS
eukprot:COSAG01_NODE_1019_length_12097_cov_7.650942_7_plen_193_part_00